MAELLQRLEAQGDLGASGYGDEDLTALLLRLDAQEKQAREESFGPSALERDSQASTRVQPGELWQLGRHRLLCGDATKPEN